MHLDPGIALLHLDWALFSTSNKRLVLPLNLFRPDFALDQKFAMSRYQLRSTVRSKPAEHSDLDVSSAISRRLRRRNNLPKAVATQPFKDAVTVVRKPQFRFLALPLEIRQQIYLYLTHGPIVSKNPRHRSYSETDLDAKRFSLLFANRQLHQEFRPLVLDNVVFRVPFTAAFDWTCIKHFAIDIVQIRQSLFPKALSQVAMRADYHKLLPSIVPRPSRLESGSLFVGREGRQVERADLRIVVEVLGLPQFGHMRTGEWYTAKNPTKQKLMHVIMTVVHISSAPSVVGFMEVLWQQNVGMSLELRPASYCGRVCQIAIIEDWSWKARAVRSPDVVVDPSHSWKLPSRARYSREYMRRLREEEHSSELNIDEH